MKNKILFGIMALVMGIWATGCSDDDYAINQQPLLTDNSVVTGSADVTATSATLHGTVSGLESQASSAYVIGFNYGAAADALTERIIANIHCHGKWQLESNYLLSGLCHFTRQSNL